VNIPAQKRTGLTAGNDPEHWRWRAEMARTIADTFNSDQAREAMLTIARCYDQLAALAHKSPIQKETAG
jgi:predicted secreted Zn-dependent protease